MNLKTCMMLPTEKTIDLENEVVSAVGENVKPISWQGAQLSPSLFVISVNCAWEVVHRRD